MSLLSRYKRSGGFLNLVQLIETCTPRKQDQLLSTIGSEDQRWSQMIQQKMLKPEIIFSWPEAELKTILSQVNDLTVARALDAVAPEVAQKILGQITGARRLNIKDMHDSESKTEREGLAALLKIVEVTRTLCREGVIRLQDINDSLVIPQDIEEQLQNGSLAPNINYDIDPDEGAAPSITEVASGPTANNKDVVFLKKQVAQLHTENQKQKAEISKLKSKLSQIQHLLAS